MNLLKFKALFVVLFVANNLAAQWTLLGGGALNNVNSSNVVSTTGNDAYYISFVNEYNNGINSGKLHIREYKNKVLSSIENPFYSSPSLTNSCNSMLVHKNELHMAFTNSKKNGRVSVAKYNNGWTLIGDTAITTLSAGKVQLTELNDTLYLGYFSNVENAIYYLKFNGQNWISLPSLTLSNVGDSHFELKASDNDLYVLYLEGGFTKMEYLSKMVNGNWVKLTSSTSKLNASATLSFKDNIPHLFYRDYETTFRARIDRFVNNTWETILNSPTTDFLYPSLVFMNDSTFAGISEVGDNAWLKAKVMSVKNGSWTNVGAILGNNSKALSLSRINNFLYFSFEELTKDAGNSRPLAYEYDVLGIDIPDTNFRKALLAKGIDVNNDGYIQYKEVENIKSLNVSSKSIINLKGIEGFTSLTNLDCSGNKIIQPDFSKNNMLDTLNCSNNFILNLDLSKNRQLKNLDCSSNLIDQLLLTQLNELNTLVCANNKITTLNLKANDKLTSIDCSNNLLEDLFVFNNLELASLNCQGNPDLQSICIDQLQVAKTNVWYKDANADWSTDCGIVNIPDIKFLNALISEGVDTNNDGEIQYVEAFSVSNLNVSNKGIQDMKGIEAFVNLNSLICSGNQQRNLDLSKNLSLTNLDCSKNYILNLTLGSILFENINCSNNDINTLDLKAYNSLKKLDCSKNELSNLNLNNNSLLERLVCTFNPIDTLQTSSNLNLAFLECSYSYITFLNIQSNLKLDTLICSASYLNRLDISENLLLSYVVCDNNRDLYDICINETQKEAANSWLKNSFSRFSTLCEKGDQIINIPDQQFLKALIDNGLDKNNDGKIQFRELEGVNKIVVPGYEIHDLTGIEAFTDLEILNCSYNNLTTVSLENNKKLKELNCSDNDLNNLNVSFNEKLVELYCVENENLSQICISASQVIFTEEGAFAKGDNSEWSTSCIVTAIENDMLNEGSLPEKEIYKVINSLGQEIKPESTMSGVFIYQYKDGTSQKVVK